MSERSTAALVVALLVAAPLLLGPEARAQDGADCPRLDGAPVPCAILANPAPVAQSNFGNAVAALDFDGDGALDVAAGAPAKTTGDLPGRAWVFYGPGFSERHELVPSASAPGDRFGFALAVHDFDGDGRDEIAVGAPGAEAGGVAGAGCVFLFRRGASGPSQLAVLASERPAEGAGLGWSLAFGDFLADARTDLAASAPFATVPHTGLGAGAVSVFRGPLAVGLQSVLPFDQRGPVEKVLYNPNPTSDVNRFGNRLIGADRGGDGRSDLVVAAIFNDVTDGGRTYPFAGQILVYASPVSQPTEVLDNPLPSLDPPYEPGSPSQPCVYRRYGSWLDARDLEGDGCGEIAVGAHRIDSTSGVCDAGRGVLWPSGAAEALIFEHPLPPEDEDLMGWRLVLGDLVGGSSLDVGVAALSKLKPDVLFLWDGDDVAGRTGLAGPPAATLLPASEQGPHFAEGIVAADLDGAGHDDLVMGDFDFGTGPLDKVGRVVVAYMP